jgi:cobalt/nickel transport system permease protein
MHVGNGQITPTCAAIGIGLSGTAWAYAALSLRKLTTTPQPLAFASAVATVFALQAFNITVLPGVSGHLVGAFLLAWWFGAFWGLSGITLVLLAQSLLFGDGGWMSFGLNVLTMGVIPCLVVAPAVRRIRRAGIAGVALGAWSSTVLASIVCGLALMSVTGPTSQFAAMLKTLVITHLAIGLIEAGITVALVYLVEEARSRAVPISLAPAAPIMLAFGAVFGASPWPDGLEHSLHTHGVLELSTTLIDRIGAIQASAQVFEDYSLVPTLVATVAVGVVAMGVTRIFTRQPIV